MIPFSVALFWMRLALSLMSEGKISGLLDKRETYRNTRLQLDIRSRAWLWNGRGGRSGPFLLLIPRYRDDEVVYFPTSMINSNYVLLGKSTQQLLWVSGASDGRGREPEIRGGHPRLGSNGDSMCAPLSASDSIVGYTCGPPRWLERNPKDN